MNGKIKIIYNFTKTAFKKIKDLTSSNFYHENNFGQTIIKVICYPYKFGFPATISKIKHEIRRISNVKNIRHSSLSKMIDKKLLFAWHKNNQHKVTIIIPSFNDYDLLKRCIESVFGASLEMDLIKILIVDDYCHPLHAEKLKTLENDQIKIVFREKNGGFARAINSGLRVVETGNDVVLLNSNIIARTGWLEALQYAAYAIDKNVGIVGPKLLYPDNRIQSAGSYRNQENRECFDHYYKYQRSDYGPANISFYVESTTSACMYIKSNVLKKLGFLDEKLEFSYEDVDYCLRAWEAGFRVLYFPGAELTHYESASGIKNIQVREKEHKSLVFFWNKWGDWFDRRNVKNETDQIRIIYVLQTIGCAGGIKIVIEHANRLKNLGFDVEIWSLDKNNSIWPIHVTTRTFQNYELLTETLSKEEAIKVATWWETISAVWLASVTKGVAVNLIQEVESWFYPNDIDLQQIVIASYRKEFKNITISSYNLNELSSLGLQATLIPCGYNESIFKKLSNIQNEKFLLSVGRTFFQKNFQFLFNVWKKFEEKRPDFWLFGIEPHMQSWDPKITYVTKPSDEELNIIYNQAEVFIQASYHEGFCLPILEAMAAGTPVICTDMHGNRDFCIDGKNCLMIEQNNEGQLLRAIETICQNPKIRNKLIHGGLETAKKYQWNSIIIKLSEFYNRVATPNEIKIYVQSKYASK